MSSTTGEGCGDGSNIGFSRTGAGVLNVTAPDAVCRSAGAIQDQGSGTMTCTPAEFSFVLPDPLRNLPAPAKPALAASMKEWVAGSIVNNPTNIPDYCPGKTGAKAPTQTSAQGCTLGQGGAQANRKWILLPGLYPGGLNPTGSQVAGLRPRSRHRHTLETIRCCCWTVAVFGPQPVRPTPTRPASSRAVASVDDS